jgi:hypothetical protein
MTSVWDEKDPCGRPRFYPPGCHPATAQQRALIRRLEEFPPSPARDELLEYAKKIVMQVDVVDAEHRVARQLYYDSKG